MKVAFQLFGHLRTFEHCAASLCEHVLDRYPDRDVFVHTWDRLEAETVMHHPTRCLPTPVDDAVRAAIERAYRPTRLRIGHQTPADHGELAFANGKRIAISGIRYMLQSMWEANRLREAHTAETGATYDVVVSLRPDVEFFRPLDLEKFLAHSRPPALPQDETHCTRFAAYGPTPLILNDLRGLPATDVVFFAVPDVMTRVLRLAEEIDRYDQKRLVAPNRPQHIMNTYCAEIGVKVAIVDYSRPRDFEIAR